MGRIGIRNKLIYVYDALCPWCFAFTPVVRDLADHFGTRFDYEVLSGGMIRGDHIRVLGGVAESERLRERYRRIEELTGARFGERFFESVARGERLLDSEPPAVGLAAFRELLYEDPSGSRNGGDRDDRPSAGRLELDFAQRILGSIFVEGADPNDPWLYREIAEGLGVSGSSYETEYHREESRDRARYDFALSRQLRADGYPRLYLQTAIDYFHLISKGYSEFSRVLKIADHVSDFRI